MRRLVTALALVAAAAAPVRAAEPVAIQHPATGHEAHYSGAAVAVDREGPIVTWIAGEHGENNVYVSRGGTQRLRINPSGTSADSLHQSPGIAVAPGGEIYVTWASRRPKPEGGLFASDLQLSRSLDGGKSFDPPLRVSEESPTSHSFEAIAIAADGTALVAWIETKPGEKPHTFVARVIDRGSRVEKITVVDVDETCVCCRVALTASKPDLVTVFWRKVFAGDVRDMVLARSADGGRTFAPAARVHADNWKIAACPHRGGSVAVYGRGRVHAVWYTEGSRNEPDVLYATSSDGVRFDKPKRVHVSSTSVPDHVRLAVSPHGRAVIVWEDVTAVRRRVLMREAKADALGPVKLLSQAIKAYAPDVGMTPSGEPVVVWHEERFPRTNTMILKER